MKVERGSLVRLDYDVLLDSGELFDSSSQSGPLCLRVGTEDVLPGMAEKLIGLTEGDERLIRLAPIEAVGDWDPNAVLMVPPSQLPGLPEEEGATVRIMSRDGSWVGRAYWMTADTVALDFNHPLAGQPVTVFVHVRQVIPPPLLMAGAAR